MVLGILIFKHIFKAAMCPDFGTSKNNKIFHLEKMENLLSLGVPILKHIMVLIKSLPFFAKKN